MTQERFLLGAATAAYQVEGGNDKSDFWLLEELEHTSFAEPSGDAVDHYHRFKEDIGLMKDAGLNAFRFSIEWARIEPEKGKYDSDEVAHYREVLKCCRENDITPVVTMHHFSSPQWLIREGGWNSEKVVAYFKKYCSYIAEQLGDLMEYVCTINEANMRLQMTAVMRSFARSMGMNIQVGVKLELPAEMMVGQREACEAFGGVDSVNTFQNPCTPEEDILIMQAHEAARDAMKIVSPHLKVGLTLSLHDVQIAEGGEEAAKAFWSEEFSHYLPYLQKDDFFGLQNYTRTILDKDGERPTPEDVKKTQMGYEFYPEALAHVIRAVAAELKLPIMVTENGVATSDDAERVAYITEAMAGVKRCIEEEIPVIGYLHWSLLDNFEWQLGYSKTFGLIEVDRSTQGRRPKESLYQLANIWARK